MTRLAMLALLVLSGAIHATTFAPDPLPAGLIGLVNGVTLSVLLATIWSAPDGRAALIRAWWFGVSSFCVGLYWLIISMHESGRMPIALAAAALFALCSYLAIYPAIAGYLAYRFRPKTSGPVAAALAWAAAWTLTEWLRGHVFTGFPWLNTGYAQVDTYLGDWAVVGGIYTVGFVTTLVVGTLTLGLLGVRQALLTRSRSISLIVLVSLLAMGLGWSFRQHAWSTDQGQRIVTRLVQGGVEQDMKFDAKKILGHIELHRQLAMASSQDNTDPSIVLIPETAMTVFQDEIPLQVWQNWIDLATRQHSTILIGAPLIDRKALRYTNSVIAIDEHMTVERLIKGQVDRRYDKHHLVPFGEFIPWGFRWFVDMLQIPLGDFDRGPALRSTFAIADQRIGPNICYEDIFGEELISAVNGVDRSTDATILANFSNLAWFGDTWALRQHWQMSRMRAIETSRPVLRATNTGITGAIDPKGQALDALPTMRPGVLQIAVQGQQGQTPYAKFGNLPILLLCFALLIVAQIARRPRP